MNSRISEKKRFEGAHPGCRRRSSFSNNNRIAVFRLLFQVRHEMARSSPEQTVMPRSRILLGCTLPSDQIALRATKAGSSLSKSRQIYSGDLNPNDWMPAQTVCLSGSVLVQPLRGLATTVSGSVPRHGDGPSSDAVFGTNGRVDWTDEPGYPYYLGGRNIVTGASLNFSFVSTLTNSVTGASCSVNWALHLEVHRRFWSFSH